MTEGKAVLKMYADSSFYSINLESDTVIIKNSCFEFKGNIKYPQQFFMQLINQTAYISESFFIDTGFQTIMIDTTKELNNFWDIGYGIEMKGSLSNNEYASNYLKLFDSIKYDTKLLLLELENADTISVPEAKKSVIEISKKSLLDLRQIRDSILLNYVQQNPQSQLLPWLLHRSIWRYGYNEYYQKAFEHIDGSFPQKMTVSLNVLLNKNKLKTVDKIFPLLDFISFNKPNGQSIFNKYTLVEFWFSGCVPCIKQFDLLIPIYKDYYSKGFRIVAISIDDQKSKEKYELLLKKKKYPWEQILDTNGAKTFGLNITKFPTSFLLDTKGRIIDIDISPENLNTFLNKKL